MNWQKNDNIYRPLQMAHRLVSDPNQPLDEALNQIREKLTVIKNNGCGGIVTNVCFTDYLESEHFFKIFQHTMQICKEMGLRVWLYDEHGYPSGGAGGIIVRDNPEYEAYGIVCLKYSVHKTAHFVAHLPYGHEQVISAYAVEGNTLDESTLDFRIDLMEFVDQDGTLCWDSTVNGTVYYIVSKALFEGVHAARNYHQIRRYINVIDKKAMKRFIEITYEQYKKYVGDYFGNVIEAVFTDEPSVMSCYRPKLTTANVTETPLSEPDEKIPLYPHVVWSRDFTDEFLARKGYDILPFVPMLFEGDSEKARAVRTDYHDVAAGLYEEAYFEAIGEFCSENNLKFTGHLLSEENIRGHIMDEYDFFRMMKHMHYTGIDILTSDPARVAEAPLLPKIASSVAHQYGMKRVMSETSDFMVKLAKGLVPSDRVFASYAAQYVYGINQIASYFDVNLYPASEYKYLNDAVSRMGQLLDGAVHNAPLAIYYPAKSGWQYDFPTDQVNSYRDYDKNFWDCCESFHSAIDCFEKNKIAYDLVDKNGLDCFIAKDGKLTTPFGEKFSAVYVSAVDYAVENIDDAICKMAENGVNVYVEKSSLSSFPSRLKKLIDSQKVIEVSSAEKAALDICQRNLKDIEINSDSIDNIVYLHVNLDDEDRYMFINVTEQPIFANINFKHKSKPTVYDVYKDACVDADFSNSTLSLNFEKYQVLFVSFEKE